MNKFLITLVASLAVLLAVTDVNATGCRAVVAVQQQQVFATTFVAQPAIFQTFAVPVATTTVVQGTAVQQVQTVQAVQTFAAIQPAVAFTNVAFQTFAVATPVANVINVKVKVNQRRGLLGRIFGR